MISDYSEIITFQKISSHRDLYGNWESSVDDYYKCHAYVNSLHGSEYWDAATVQQQESIEFTVRYCKKLEAITTKGFRILFRGQVYNIVHIDYLRFEKKQLKIRGELDEEGQDV